MEAREKNRNTATLLQKALNGAGTELIHLYDLRYKRCTSCFACKRKGSQFVGHCAMKDDLSDFIERVLGCDVLLLRPPVYFNNLTGERLCFLERLLFSNFSCNEGNTSVFKEKISSGFIYTMNVPEETMKHRNYEATFYHYKQALQMLFGEPSEIPNCQ